MPAQDGCHQPESGGTKCPICEYQAPVDNFANPQSFPLKGGTQPESFIVLVRGCQMPERRLPCRAPAIQRGIICPKATFRCL